MWVLITFLLQNSTLKACYHDGRRGISFPLKHLQWEVGASQKISVCILGGQNPVPFFPTSTCFSLGIMQLHEALCFFLLQSALFPLHRMLPSSAQSTPHCFRIQVTFPHKSFSWDHKQFRTPHKCIHNSFPLKKHITAVTAFLFTSLPWRQLPEGQDCVHFCSRLYGQHQTQGPTHIRYQGNRCKRNKWTHS